MMNHLGFCSTANHNNVRSILSFFTSLMFYSLTGAVADKKTTTTNLADKGNLPTRLAQQTLRLVKVPTQMSYHNIIFFVYSAMHSI
jgi:hypothetical protein